MSRLEACSVVAALLMAAGPALAADPPAPHASDAPYAQGSVWELSFIRVVPGMGDDYLRSLSVTWKRSMEEAKKQGLVLSYKILEANASGPDDWDLLLMIEFRNWAAMDGLDAKFRAIEAKTTGSTEQVRSLMTKRIEVRRILGGKMAQELILK